MPRRPRFATGGYVFHVLNRSIGRQTIFRSDADYAAFLRQLAGQTKIDTARAQLRNLADQFDRLAASIRRTALAG